MILFDEAARPFQKAMLAEARGLLRRGTKRIVLQAPTGAGKTFLAAGMTQGAVANRKRVWFVAHRDFLLDQTSGTYGAFGIEHGFIAAGRPFNPFAQVNVCMINTVANRIEKMPDDLRPDLIICDETHHATAGSWRKLIDWHRGAVVGLSATPIRLDGRGLDEVYQALVLGPPVSELIRDKFLSEYRAFSPSTPDTSGLRTRAGEYARDDVSELMDRNAVIGDMVRHWLELAKGLRSVYFAASVAHSEHIAATFTANGIPSMHLDGNTPAIERRRACRMLARGELLMLSNVELFGEGFDLAAQAQEDVTVDCVGLARPTQSLTLHTQQVGRALRVSAGKKYGIILDHAGNILRHGLPDEDREWSLEGKKKDDGEKSDGMGTKNCKSCFSILPTVAKKCQYCGYVYEIEAREIEHVDGDLHEMDAETVARLRVKTEDQCRTIEDFLRLAHHLKKRNPESWAAKKFQRREGIRSFVAEQQFAAYARR